MQRDRTRIGAVTDDRDHLPPGSSLAADDQFTEQRRAYPTSSLAVRDIHAVLDGVAISRPRAVEACIGKTRDHASCLGYEVRQTQIHRGATARQHVVERRRRFFKGGQRVEDVMLQMSRTAAMSDSSASRTSVTPRKAQRCRSETLDLRLSGRDLPGATIAKTRSAIIAYGNNPRICLVFTTRSTPIAIAAMRPEMPSRLARASTIAHERSSVCSLGRITSSFDQKYCCRS